MAHPRCELCPFLNLFYFYSYNRRPTVSHTAPATGLKSDDGEIIAFLDKILLLLLLLSPSVSCKLIRRRRQSASRRRRRDLQTGRTGAAVFLRCPQADAQTVGQTYVRTYVRARALAMPTADGWHVYRFVFAAAAAARPAGDYGGDDDGLPLGAAAGRIFLNNYSQRGLVVRRPHFGGTLKKNLKKKKEKKGKRKRTRE